MVLGLPASLGHSEQNGQSHCGTRNGVLGFLSTTYAEKPVAMGVAANGGLIEVLTSQHGATFTIIVTMPEGHTCMVAAGEGWQPVVATSRMPDT